MLLLIALVAGCAIGVGASWTWHDAWRQKSAEEARLKASEGEAEIKRLRAQVALHIGRDVT